MSLSTPTKDDWKNIEKQLTDVSTTRAQLKKILSKWADILDIPNCNYWDRNRLNKYVTQLIEDILKRQVVSFKTEPGKSIYQVLLENNITLEITDHTDTKQLASQIHHLSKNLSTPISYQGNKPYIFISYSHKDNNIAFPIINKLQTDGYNVWFDEGIEAGAVWSKEIADHIDKCSEFIAIISKNYFNSTNCCDELHYVRNLDKDNIIIIYTSDEFNRPNDFRLRHDRKQALVLSKFENEERFWEKFYHANHGNLQRCKNNIL